MMSPASIGVRLDRSTSGGIKADRMVIFWKSFVKRISKIRHPRAVITPKLDGLLLESDLIETNLLYIVLYVAIVFLSTVALSAFDVDLLTAFSGSATAMGACLLRQRREERGRAARTKSRM